MTLRLDYAKAAPGLYQAMDALDEYLQAADLDPALLHLVRLRASQLNGCAYCIDMHWKDLRALGEGEQRLYGLDAWQETSYYTPRERAALAWTEAVTLVAQGRVPDAVHQAARREFGEKELCDLTLAVVAINGWNRLCVAARLEPGSYQPAVTAG